MLIAINIPLRVKEYTIEIATVLTIGDILFILGYWSTW